MKTIGSGSFEPELAVLGLGGFELVPMCETLPGNSGRLLPGVIPKDKRWSTFHDRGGDEIERRCT